MKIFTVTTLFTSDPNNTEKFEDCRPRTVAFFETLERAQSCVTTNEGDLEEAGYYNYVVIEELGPGMYPTIHDHQQWWYVRKGSEWVPAEKPECFKRICGFGIG